MADEGKLHRDKARGAQAKREREGKLIDEFLEKAKQECHAVFAKSMPDESQVREDAYWLLKAIAQIEQAYTSTIGAGQVAESELLQLQAEKDK